VPEGLPRRHRAKRRRACVVWLVGGTRARRDATDPQYWISRIPGHVETREKVPF
jgi:hypothetical protein